MTHGRADPYHSSPIFPANASRPSSSLRRVRLLPGWSSPDDHGPESDQTLWPRDRAAWRQLRGPLGAGSRLPRPQRRRQVDDDEDHHRLPDRDVGQGDRRRPRCLRARPRGPPQGRLPAREQPALPRHARRRLPALRRQDPRHAGRPPARRPRARRRLLRHLQGLQEGHLRAVEGLPPARRPRAGDAARPRDPYPRRAHLGPRPEPDRRDPPADPLDRRPRGPDGHPLDPLPPGGRGDERPDHDHLARRDRRRREHAGARRRVPGRLDRHRARGPGRRVRSGPAGALHERPNPPDGLERRDRALRGRAT